MFEAMKSTRDSGNQKKTIISFILVAVILCIVVVALFVNSTSKEVVSKYENTISVGMAYVSEECIYMNAMSSYWSGGNSGYRYIIQEGSLQFLNRFSNKVVGNIEVDKWEWQELPYTNEEWADLFYPTIFISLEGYDEILYQPLDKSKFMLQVDGELWLVNIHSTPERSYVWCIYSLVVEESKGLAQWEYEPEASEDASGFPFVLDMDYTLVSVVTSAGQLVNCETQELGDGIIAYIYPAGSPLVWSPVDEAGNVDGGTNIEFSINVDNNTIASGILQIVRSMEPDGKMVYSATLIANDLQLTQNHIGEGGVITYTGTQNIDISVHSYETVRQDEQLDLSQETIDYYMEMEPACSYVTGEGMEYRMVEIDRALGSSIYAFLSVTDNGKTCVLANKDPFNGSGGEVKWLAFLDEKLGFACLLRNGGDYGYLYRTEDGGKNWQRMEYSTDHVQLVDGTYYNPFDVPEKIYEKDGKLFLEAEQGADGDYHVKGQSCYGLYQSDDDGKTWSLIEEVLIRDWEVVTIYPETYTDLSLRNWDMGDGDEFGSVYERVIISNVTSEGFDFTILRKDYDTEEEEVLIPLTTARYGTDGVSAIATINDDTLVFDFSINTNSFPVVVFFTIDGYEEVEGVTFGCSWIPGFEYE